MPKTLAEINDLLGKEDAASLQKIIADIKEAVRVSDAGVIAGLEALVAANTAAAEQAALAATTEADKALAQAKEDAANAMESLRAVHAGEVEKLNAQLSSERSLASNALAEANEEISQLRDINQRLSDSSNAQIASANDALKAQVARSLALAARLKAAREKRRQADAAYAAIDPEDDALIAELSQPLEEQQKAQAQAEIEALQARIMEAQKKLA